MAVRTGPASTRPARITCIGAALLGLAGCGVVYTAPAVHQGEAFGISSDGSTVVGYGGSLQPLVWDAEHGTRSLKAELLAEGDPRAGSRPI